tara:strand:- start:243 stop:446 length:204 start_codon:yes stop_codon:yes gene_type:complete
MKGSSVSIKTEGENVLVTYSTESGRKSYLVKLRKSKENPPVAIASFAQNQDSYFQLMARVEKYLLKQ